MRPLPPFRRVTALLVSLLLAQLTLSSTVGAACAAAGGAHATMVMKNAAAQPAMLASGSGNCGGCGAPNGRVPCDSPSSPDACAQMTSCAAAVVAERSPVLELSLGWYPTQAVAAAAFLLPGPALAPEPPPPRA
jgi:hypothetical protein